MAERAGFTTLADGVRVSVLASKRLVQVLDLLTDRSFSPRGASAPVAAERVVAATAASRAAVGVLAQSRPRRGCSHRTMPITAAASASSLRLLARWQERA